MSEDGFCDFPHTLLLSSQKKKNPKKEAGFKTLAWRFFLRISFYINSKIYFPLSDGFFQWFVQRTVLGK